MLATPAHTPSRGQLRKSSRGPWCGALLAAAVGTLLGACGGGGTADTMGPDPMPTPTIALALTSSSGSVQPVGEISTTLTLTRGGGYTGSVSLSASGLPDGVSAIFGPPTLSSSVSSAVFTLGVDDGAAPGSYPIAITATGAGVSTATATYQLTLTAPPDFTLSVVPESLTVVQGEESTGLLQLQRLLGLSAPVSVSFDLGSTPLSGALSVAFARDTLTGSAATDSVSFAVAVDFALVPGAYPITLRGQSAGLDDRTVTLVVVVEAPPSPGQLLLPDRITTPQSVASTPATVVLQRGPGVTGPVTFSLDNLPDAVTAAFAPNPTPGDSATLVLTPSFQHPVGSVSLAVRATVGALSVVDTLTLSTQQFFPPDFGLAVPVPSIVVTAGASTPVTLTVNRTGNYTGDVSVALVGAPAGMTATVNPSPVTGTSALLTISAAGTVGDGSYPVTIEGTGVGLNGTRTVPLTVAVIAPTSNSITWQFCDAARIPEWFAVRSGGIQGPWTRVMPTAPGTFTFPYPSNGQVAYVRTGANGSELRIFQYRPAEMFQQSALECAEYPGTKTVSGTVANVNAGQAMSIAMGGTDSLYPAPPSAPLTNFTLNGVGDRTTDLLAVRGTYLSNTFASLLRAIVRRDVNPAAGSTLPAFDFDGTEWVQFAGSRGLFFGLEGDPFRTEMGLRTSNGFVGTYFRDAFSTDSARTHWGLPSSERAPSDLHRATAVTSHPVTPRRVVRYRQDVAFFQTTFGPRLDMPAITVSGTAPVQMRSFGQWSDAYGFDVSTTYRQGTGATARTVIMASARAYFGALSTGYNYALPDFTGVAGWNPDWMLQAGVPVSYEHWVSGLENGVTRAPVQDLNILSGGYLGTVTP